MHDAAISLKKSDIFDITLTPIFSKAIMKSKKFDDILNDFFGNSTFGNLSKPFACISTDLISGKVFCFYDGLVKTAVRASCSIPIGFKPVKYENMLLVDGGISNRTPVAECRALGADVVVAVDVLAELPEMDKITNIFSLGYRALDIMGVNIDMRHDEKQRPDLLLLPELGKTSQYKVENQQFCYDKGYELGINSIDKIKALIS
jgi:NTE family protein